MEADSAFGVSEGAGAVCGSAGDEEASTGDNSLTSCEDDMSTATDGAEDIIKLQLQERPTPSHSSACAPGTSHGTLASGLPSTLQLCKVHPAHTHTHTAKQRHNPSSQTHREHVQAEVNDINVQKCSLYTLTATCSD